MYSAYSPDRSLKYESDFPSGDHAGSCSADALELVRLRTSPLSAGIVKISPRASTRDALAGRREREVGHRSRDTSFHCGIIHGKSPVAVIGTTCSLPVFGSSRWM